MDINSLVNSMNKNIETEFRCVWNENPPVVSGVEMNISWAEYTRRHQEKFIEYIEKAILSVNYNNDKYKFHIITGFNYMEYFIDCKFLNNRNCKVEELIKDDKYKIKSKNYDYLLYNIPEYEGKVILLIEDSNNIVARLICELMTV